VTLLTCRGLSPNWTAQHGGKPRIDPGFDVLDDQFLVYVVEAIMKSSFIELQCFVGVTGHFVEVFAAAGPRVLVEGAVKNGSAG